MRKLAYVLACVLGVSVSAQAVRAMAKSNPDAIPNFRIIDDGIAYRGGRPGDTGIAYLAGLKVRTVIDLQGGDLENPVLRPVVALLEPGEKPESIEAEGRAAASHKMSFFSEPLNSMKDLDERETEEVEQALRIMHDPAYQPVYIHCEHGNDRTGLVSALYRVRYDGWTPEKAHDEMVQDGHRGWIDHLVTGALDDTFWRLAPGMAKLYQEDSAP